MEYFFGFIFWASVCIISLLAYTLLSFFAERHAKRRAENAWEFYRAKEELKAHLKAKYRAPAKRKTVKKKDDFQGVRLLDSITGTKHTIETYTKVYYSGVMKTVIDCVYDVRTNMLYFLFLGDRSSGRTAVKLSQLKFSKNDQSNYIVKEVK